MPAIFLNGANIVGTALPRNVGINLSRECDEQMNSNCAEVLDLTNGLCLTLQVVGTFNLIDTENLAVPRVKSVCGMQ